MEMYSAIWGKLESTIQEEYKAILSVLCNDNSLPVVFLAAPPEADREVEDDLRESVEVYDNFNKTLT